jgi:hypothetical protein
MQIFLLFLTMSTTAANANWIKIAPPAQTGLVSRFFGAANPWRNGALP